MLTRIISIEAEVGPLAELESNRELAGYFQAFGVSAEDEAGLLELVRDYLQSDLGCSLAEVTEQWVPDFDGSDSDLREFAGNVEEVGIWYASNRAWFGPE